MANTNSAENLGEKGYLKMERHATLTFTEVSGTQEIDADHEQDDTEPLYRHVSQRVTNSNGPRRPSAS